MLPGIDYRLARKREHVGERREILQAKLDKLARKPSNDAVKALIHHGEEALKKVEEEIHRFEEAFCGRTDAQVIAHGTVYAGTEIRICRRLFEVKEEMKAVRFRLDAETDRIVTEPC